MCRWEETRDQGEDQADQANKEEEEKTGGRGKQEKHQSPKYGTDGICFICARRFHRAFCSGHSYCRS